MADDETARLAVAGYEEISIHDVDEYLTANKKFYEEHLRNLISMVKSRISRSDAAEAVYRIYSRQDKQGGDIFKNRRKIVNKINDWRRSNVKEAMEQNRQAPKPILPKDVYDLTGFTIVVVYPSDVSRVCRVIEDLIDEERLKSLCDDPEDARKSHPDLENRGVRHGQVKTAKGYYAHHYSLKLRNNHRDRFYGNAVCEVQIKTLLHDAWGVKTHDLSYKNEGHIDQELTKQIEVLGDALAVLDQQSEIVKTLIQRSWKVLRRKSGIAHSGIFKHLDDEIGEEGTPLEALRVKAVALDEECQQESNEEVVHEKVSNYIEELLAFTEENQHSQETSRLFCFAATLSNSKFHVDVALERTRNFAHEAVPEEKAKAYHFAGLTAFGFGMREDALDFGKKAQESVNLDTVQKAETDLEGLALRRNTVAIYSNLAYYYADLVGSDTGRKIEADKHAVDLTQKAKTIFEDLREGLPEDKREDWGRGVERLLQDTDIFVDICTQTSPQGVQDALNKLEHLSNETPETEKIDKAYHDYHRYRGMERIVALENENTD